MNFFSQKKLWGLLIAGLLFSACGQVKINAEKINVVATFYPLAEIAEEVGGDIVSVYTVVPAGQEPHDYEPTPKDLVEIYGARLFLVNGASLDAWAQKITSGEKTAVVTMETALNLNSSDPHFWLDPMLFAKEVEIVRDALIEIDPSNMAYYTNNAAAYTEQLQDLDTAYRTGLAQCAQNTIVSAHDAFGYLAKAYNLTVLPIAGISPDEEPSPNDIAALTEIVKEKEISVIFFEELVSPRIAETLAVETGAEVLVLNPLEGLTEEQIASGESYISIMQQNLDHLRIALICQ